MVRVIQWATGPVGSAQLREIIDDPGLELAGIFAYNPAKVGVDAGTLVRRPPTDKSAILALDAACKTTSASKAVRENTNTDDIVELLASGKSVITTTSYSHLPTYGRETEQRIINACKHSGARFHAAGEHPGFMFERLATTLTGLSQRVDRIIVSEFVDCSAVKRACSST
jgi:2,4-diaminopentanoate dehydrogenase